MGSVRRALLPSAAVAGVVVAIGPALAGPLVSGLGPDARATFVALAPYVGLAVFADVLGCPQANACLVAGSPRAASFVQVGASLLTGATMVILAHVGEPIDVARGLAFANVVRVVAVAIALERRLAPTSSSSPLGLDASIRSFSLPLGAHAAASRLHRHLDKALVVLVLGESAGAAYAAVSFEIPFLTALAFSFGTAVVGRYVAAHQRGDVRGLLALHRRGIRKLGLAVVPAAVFVVAFADRLVPVVLGTGYEDAVPAFRIATLVGFQRVAQFGVVLQAAGETKSILLLTGTMVALDLVLAPPAMLAFGIAGAAGAATLASTLVFALYQLRIARVLGVPLRAVFPFGAYARQLALAASLALLVERIDAQLRPFGTGAVALVACTLVFLVTYLVAGTLLGVVRRADFRSLAFLFGYRPRVRVALGEFAR